VKKPRRGNDWITWVLVIAFILAGFLIGLYFLNALPIPRF
jgi:hypothetical protein